MRGIAAGAPCTPSTAEPCARCCRAQVFTKHCYMEWRNDVWRDCYSDEQYLGTLLASKVPTLPFGLLFASGVHRGRPCVVHHGYAGVLGPEVASSGTHPPLDALSRTRGRTMSSIGVISCAVAAMSCVRRLRSWPPQGLDNQTDCLGYLTYTSWVWGQAHPQAFAPQDIGPDRRAPCRHPAAPWLHCATGKANLVPLPGFILRPGTAVIVPLVEPVFGLRLTCSSHHSRAPASLGSSAHKQCGGAVRGYQSAVTGSKRAYQETHAPASMHACAAGYGRCGSRLRGAMRRRRS